MCWCVKCVNVLMLWVCPADLLVICASLCICSVPQHDFGVNCPIFSINVRKLMEEKLNIDHEENDCFIVVAEFVRHGLS